MKEMAAVSKCGSKLSKNVVLALWDLLLSSLSCVVTLAVVELEKCFAPKWKAQAMLNVCLKYHDSALDLNKMVAVSK